ncbi:MAG: hypothetical protein CL489_10345 [Acidobacteria bacterium]|nr:hypothetical protein [Acidobacteriota bacterium]|tara:strand:+ start:13982 stop:14500 length:519 start_codon:yes stop_codon:yes gene_type:complete
MKKLEVNERKIINVQVELDVLMDGKTPVEFMQYMMEHGLADERMYIGDKYNGWGSYETSPCVRVDEEESAIDYFRGCKTSLTELLKDEIERCDKNLMRWVESLKKADPTDTKAVEKCQSYIGKWNFEKLMWEDTKKTLSKARSTEKIIKVIEECEYVELNEDWHQAVREYNG